MRAHSRRWQLLQLAERREGSSTVLLRLVHTISSLALSLSLSIFVSLLAFLVAILLVHSTHVYVIDKPQWTTNTWID